MTTTRKRTEPAYSISETKPLTGRIAGFLKTIPTWTLWVFVVVWTIPTLRTVHQLVPNEGRTARQRLVDVLAG